MQADGTAQRCASGGLHMSCDWGASVIHIPRANALCSTAASPRRMCVYHACGVVHAAKCAAATRGEGAGDGACNLTEAGPPPRFERPFTGRVGDGRRWLRMTKRKAAAAPGVPSGNFCASEAPGCHVCHGLDAPWILGHEMYDPDEYEPGATLPDVAVDPQSGIVTAVNTSADTRALVLSTSHPCTGKHGIQLQAGSSCDGDGVVFQCMTLVLVLPPKTLLHACRLPRSCLAAPHIDSDVQVLTPHAAPLEVASHVFAFPFGPGRSFLCSQGFGGAFTHFHASTHHAIDFSCPVGTPVLAVLPGRVVDVKSGHTCSGIHVRNLFTWNGILVQLADGSCVEYVHLSAVHVTFGDEVKQGQHIADSGSVGFSPVPHLHIQLLVDASKTAWTKPFCFKDAQGRTYTPVAGDWYDASGPEAHSTTVC